MGFLKKEHKLRLVPQSSRQKKAFLPIMQWAKRYHRANLPHDLLAGIIVTAMLVPQSMAYALLAGLPPQAGLYASLLPMLLYGISGTSRALSVAPIAIVSLMTASGIAQFAESGTIHYWEMAMTLALMVGLLKICLRLFHAGFLVNFLSHPILLGFTSAAAFIIGTSQLKYLLGFSVPRLTLIPTLRYIIEHLEQTNIATLLLGGTAIIILLYFKYGIQKQLRRWDVPFRIAVPLARSGPLLVAALGTAVTGLFNLPEQYQIQTVGTVPAELPPLAMPTFDWLVWQQLLPTAVAITFVGFTISISVAQSLASKKREKIDANQELFALGLANIGAAFTSGFPISGGFSRSIVNDSAGARSGLAGIITALLMGVTLLFLTPLFYYLPQAILAAIIFVAIIGLIDIKASRKIWQYSKSDGVSLLITFVAVIILGVETGIFVGAGTALLLFIWRTSQPYIAEVGRLPNSTIYRNVLRHEVTLCPDATAIRVDQSLYFANMKYVEDALLDIAADRPELNHLILIGTAINFIDASALETIFRLQQELAASGVTLHLAAFNGPVLDRLEKIGFLAEFGTNHIHPDTYAAMQQIGCIQESV